MVDPGALSRWLHWIGFVVLAVIVLVLDFLPLELGEGRWPGPQWVLAFAMAWTLRRPDFLPILLAAAIALMIDLLYMRPPGLWAALTVLVLEFLRMREHASREWPFLVEWGVVALLLGAMVLVNRLVLAIFATGQPRLGIELQEYISTLLAYPLVVLVSVRVLGVVRQSRATSGSQMRARA